MSEEKKEKDYVCIVCGHRIPESDFLLLPEEVGCPECGVSKQDYYLEDFDN